MRPSWEDVLPAIAALLCWYVIPLTPYPTYDDGWNIHLLHQFSKGDWGQLWHHGSPLFYLFWLPIYKLGSDYQTLCLVNACLGLAGLFLLLKKTAPVYASSYKKIALWAIMALSPLAIVNSACFTVEAGGLLLLASALTTRSKFWEGLFLACACLWNYKSGLVAGICIAWHLYQNKQDIWNLSKGFLAGFCLPFGSLIFLYVSLNGWANAWIPLGTYAGLLLRDANPDAPTNAIDFLFYLKYIFEWDAWHLWVLGLWGLWMTYRTGKMRREGWIIIALIVSGLFLPKAPRWLLPAFPLMAGYILVMLERIPVAWQRIGVMGALMYGGISVLRQGITQQLEAVSPLKNSQDICKHWQQNQARNLCLFTSGTNLQCFLDTICLNYLPGNNTHKADPNSDILMDGYTLISGLPQKTLYRMDTVYEGKTPTNGIPLLWLEHAEFTGKTFDQTMESWHLHKAASAEVVILRNNDYSCY